MRFRLLLPAFIVCLVLITICGTLPEVGAAPRSTATPTATPLRLSTRASPSDSTDASGRHYEREGGFSFVPPKGWKIETVRGFKYKSAVDYRPSSFPPNIVLTDDPYDGSLEAFTLMFKALARNAFQSLTVIEQKPFVPDGGTSAIRLVIESVQNRLTLHQTIYLFDGGDFKIIAICSRLADRHKDVDALCDASLKTFRLEAKPKATPTRKPLPPVGTSTWKGV
jgi:hypothetical protein